MGRKPSWPLSRCCATILGRIGAPARTPVISRSAVHARPYPGGFLMASNICSCHVYALHTYTVESRCCSIFDTASFSQLGTTQGCFLFWCVRNCILKNIIDFAVSWLPWRQSPQGPYWSIYYRQCLFWPLKVRKKDRCRNGRCEQSHQVGAHWGRSGN